MELSDLAQPQHRGLGTSHTVWQNAYAETPAEAIVESVKKVSEVRRCRGTTHAAGGPKPSFGQHSRA